MPLLKAESRPATTWRRLALISEPRKIVSKIVENNVEQDNR